MRVRVEDANGVSVWSYGEGYGETSSSHLQDGTQERIVEALLQALAEARGQSGCALQVLNVVTNIRAAAAEV